MKRVLSIGLCVFCLQACAAQDEASTMRADLSSTALVQQQNKKFIVNESNTASQRSQLSAQNEKDEYHPYIIYNDEGIDKDAIKASKHIDFADDPHAPILADFTEEPEPHTHTAQNHLIINQNISSGQRQVASAHKHELKNNFVSNKFKNMEECTAEIIKHMLRSPIFAKHNSSALVIGKVTNKTGDDTLPIGQIERVLQSAVSQADFIKIVHTNLDRSASKFDYTTNVLVQNSDESNKKGSYTIRVQLLNFYGELVGQWSAQTS